MLLIKFEELMLLVKLALFILFFWPLTNLLGRLFLGLDNKKGQGIIQFCGLTVLAAFIAVFSTAGITILIPVVFFFLFRTWKGRNNWKLSILKEIYIDSIPVILFSLILCFCFSPLLVELETTKLLSGDYLFYGKLGEYILATGNETKDLNYFSHSAGTQVYHYLDLWLIGFVNRFTGITSNQAVIFVYYVLFISVLYLAFTDFVSLFTSRKTAYFLSVFIVGLLICISGANYLMLFLFGENEFGHYSGFFYPKLLLIYILIILIFASAWERESRSFFDLICIGILSYATLIPSLLVVSFSYLWFENKWSMLRLKNLKPVVLLILTVIYFGVFYILHPSGFEPNHLFKPEFDLMNINTRINIIGKTVILMLLGSLPLLLMLAFVWKNNYFKNYRQVFFILFSGCMSGLISWSILFEKTDAVQLWYNFYFPFVGILYCTFVVIFLLNIKVLALLPFILIDVYFTNQGLKFLEESNVSSVKFKFLMNKRIGYFNFYDQKLNVYSKNDAVYFGNLWGVAGFTNAKLISISAPEINVIDAQYEAVVKSSNLFSISKFEIGTEHPFDYQKKMIDSLQLDYIFVNKKRTKNLFPGKNWKEVYSPEPEYLLFQRNSLK